MSTEWGSLTHDRAFRAADDGAADETAPTEVEDELAGAWSEDLDTEFFAESSMTIPGESEPGENCGVWGPQDFCDECGEVGFGPSQCEQRGCPNCWWKWSGNRAEKGVVRLGAARYAADEAQDKRAVHTVASPPEGEIRTLVDVQQGFRDAYALAKERGVRGGVCIFHGFRVTDEAKDVFRELTDLDVEEANHGIWRWIREHTRNWRSLTYWSPHYHIIGLARDIEADTGDDSDVWRFRRVRSMERFELTDKDGYDDMAGAFRYLLSHLTFESGTSKDSVRWFGSLSTAKFSPEEELSEGALSTIQRYAEEVVGSIDDRGDGDDDGHQEECECEECGATSRSPIWDAGGALMDPSWCEEIGREQEARLAAAFEWAVGDRQPPPGLKRPTTEEECAEAFAELV